MSLGASPASPRVPGPKWWQANSVSVDKTNVTDMCHDCGHTRDLHSNTGACMANVDWADITAKACGCSQVNHWVKAEIKGIEL